MTAQMTPPAQEVTSSNSTTAILLLDPTSPGGEAALSGLTPDDTDVVLVTLVTGPCSDAIRAYALGEGLDLSTAAWMYLSQVQDKVSLPGRTIELVVATGPDAGLELDLVMSQRPDSRVLVPRSAMTADRYLRAAVAHRTDVAVIDGVRNAMPLSA